MGQRRAAHYELLRAERACSKHTSHFLGAKAKWSAKASQLLDDFASFSNSMSWDALGRVFGRLSYAQDWLVVLDGP